MPLQRRFNDEDYDYFCGRAINRIGREEYILVDLRNSLPVVFAHVDISGLGIMVKEVAKVLSDKARILYDGFPGEITLKNNETFTLVPDPGDFSMTVNELACLIKSRK